MVSSGRKAERATTQKAAKAAAMRRASPFRLPQRHIYIVCEGVCTEPQYFEWYRKQYRKNVSVTTLGLGAGPYQVVERAVEKRLEVAADSNPYAANDEVWAVFDRDEHLLSLIHISEPTRPY